jgi:hypothetical protein
VDKRFQVFVSSTYADLKDERQAVIRAVMELDCIPAGMELFPAADEEQFEFIKRVIDDCDYYLLIIGGRYGSITEEGISYTEQEYDYAVKRGLRVIALLHENPDEIPLGKSEKDDVLREKLRKFRERVSDGRLVKFWKTADDLAGKVALSLSQTIKTYPAVGWVRANRAASEQILTEINELRKHSADVQQLFAAQKAELDRLKSPPLIQGLAGLDEEVILPGICYNTSFSANRNWKITTTWRMIFAHVSPYLITNPTADEVMRVLASALFAAQNEYGGNSPTLDDQSFRTVSIQLKALGLVKFTSSKTVLGEVLHWSLTPAGERLMMDVRTVRSAQTKVREV